MAKEQSSAPSISPVNTQSSTINGTGTLGSTITVTFPNCSKLTTTADNNGNWLVNVPADTNLKENDTIGVTEKTSDTLESNPTNTTVSTKYN